MPTYDYVCSVCHFSFERLQKMSELAITLCPQCQGKVKRKISGGSGFLIKESRANPRSCRKAGKSCSSENSEQPCCGNSEGCDKSSCDERE